MSIKQSFASHFLSQCKQIRVDLRDNWETFGKLSVALIERERERKRKENSSALSKKKKNKKSEKRKSVEYIYIVNKRLYSNNLNHSKIVVLTFN